MDMTNRCTCFAIFMATLKLVKIITGKDQWLLSFSSSYEVTNVSGCVTWS